jgi:hypothetical protein
MIPHSPPLPYLIDSPEVQRHAIDQRQTGHDGEAPSAEEGDGVTEVEERGGDAAEDDGELEPGEEGAFGGKEDFGLDADGDVDAWGGKGGLVGGFGCLR